MGKNKTYFISDVHLGVDGTYSSKERELKLVAWLDKVKFDAEAIYFLGDIFDHWFEYKNVIPKGFSDFIGKVAELRRMNIPIYFFTGNHDMWMFGYFEEELGIPIIRKPLVIELGGKQFYLNHGDALKNGPLIDRLMKLVFASNFLQWCFARFHPNFAIGIMKYFSKRSRLAQSYSENKFVLEDEHMIEYSEHLLVQHPTLDYILMGHRHLPIDLTLSNGKTRFINLGDWVSYFSFVVFDGKDLKIEFFENEHGIYP